ncbi:hypothetical protein BS50DRAFT_620275 [Corynespora cassiicola Philippines]|uniref:Uncharacterized protein n=1 Tax=Corynespora cassiicola Philippines TaxID=1448308 RepID=A0A2T2NQY4_CORCC|nr:hypothetical protein BS50DRAFT_620275 [Corynespora cassiicola Philippines]
MLPGAQLLTAPTTLSNYKPENLSCTARTLLSSGLLFLQVDRDLAHPEQRMAYPQPHPASRHPDGSGLWFSMPSSARQERDHNPSPEQSAYQATSSRHGARANRSASPSRFPPIPLISTATGVNKPLPPSPDSDKRKPKPASLRSLLRRHPSAEFDPTHLQPAPYQAHQRSSSTNGKLTPEPPHNYHYHHQSSRSMPSSPLQYSHPTTHPAHLVRAHSASSYYPDSTAYQAYSPAPQHRVDSMGSGFDPQPPRTRRTFPDDTPTSATARPSVSDRPRPHTWLSPTEPFQNANEFHLFVEATSGLPGDSGPFSPDGPPRLQGSLFGRQRQNDQIPIPLQHPTYADSSWQSMGYDYYPSQPDSPLASPPLVSSSALPRRESYQSSHRSTHPSQRSPHLSAINLELERLGISDEEAPEDELPNYAQSQAEMSAKKRKEATERARELEARWNSSRSWRGR